MRSSIKALVGTKAIFTSFRVAKLFLNISSYQDYLTKSVKEAEFDVRYSTDDSRIFLDHTASKPSFCLAGGLRTLAGTRVELIFPVKAPTIAQTAPQTHEFLQRNRPFGFPRRCTRDAGRH